MRAYSADLRERVLGDCDAGMGTRAVAQKYRVSASWVRRLKPTRRSAFSMSRLLRSGGGGLNGFSASIPWSVCGTAHTREESFQRVLQAIVL